MFYLRIMALIPVVISSSFFTGAFRSDKFFSSGRRLFMAAVIKDQTKEKKKPMPITVLSGFLGAGKTSFLQHVLTNEKGTKFGLVVNDMATVNVDSKLIRQKTLNDFDGVDTLELQNGCVCCSLAEDLIASVVKLVELSDVKGVPYDHIVVECSGIAEPRKIRDLFQEAEDYGSPLLEKIKLDTLVTLVDAAVFLDLFGSDAEIKSHSTLAVSPADPQGLEKLEEEGNGMRKVTELLLEQVECADIILINKIDLLKSFEDVALLQKVLSSINPTARLFTCVKGEIDPLRVIGTANGLGAADFGVLDEHRKLVQAVENQVAAVNEPKLHNSHDHSSHDHGHEHVHDESCNHESDCDKATASSPVNTCSNTQEGHVHDESCGHSHEHAHSETCSNTQEGHVHDESCGGGHSHSHDHGDGQPCTIDHSHDHGSGTTTAEARFGITSFVYRRRRPFHPARLTLFLQSLGKLSVKGLQDMIDGVKADEDRALQDPGKKSAAAVIESATLASARRSLLRSKGFVWMATSGAAAYFMSHAGQYLELAVLGRWWADMPQKDWPQGAESEITIDFEGKHGDRRQELVFIGQFGNDSSSSREALEQVLDSCLLTDSEMLTYESTVASGEKALRSAFFPRDQNDPNV